jgi:hypothetical protein
MTPSVWIVEMWNEKRERWEPTVGCSLTKADAEHDMEYYWKADNPSGRFRVRRYRPALDAVARADAKRRTGRCAG